MTIQIEYLQEEEMEKLRITLGTTEERMRQDVESIKEWVAKQPHLPDLPDDENTFIWIRNLFVVRKNRMEAVKETLELYFSYKLALPELFKNRDPTSQGFKKNTKALYLLSLPKLTPKGYRIHYFRHVTPDPADYEPLEFMKRTVMLAEVATREDKHHGDIVLFDMTNGTWAHWGRYNVALLTKFVILLTKAYPMRVKAVHFINAPGFVSQVLKIMKPFVSEKIMSRVTVHSGNNIDDMAKDIPKDCLPEELGGTLAVSLPELNDLFTKKIASWKEWFQEDEKMIGDQSKRPQQQKNELFGIEGSFRSLSVD